MAKHNATYNRKVHVTQYAPSYMNIRWIPLLQEIIITFWGLLKTREPLYSTHPSPSLAAWYWQQSWTKFSLLDTWIEQEKTLREFTGRGKYSLPDTILPWPCSYWYTPIYVNCHILCTGYALSLQHSSQKHPAYVHGYNFFSFNLSCKINLLPLVKRLSYWYINAACIK